MAINKVIYGDETLIDLTESTVTPSTLLRNRIAFDASGNRIVGKLVTYKNQVPISINADGNIYNDGLGYKEGYRIRSSGAEATQPSSICTGFIPFKAGDTLRIYPALRTDMATTACINFSDGNFTNLGQSNQSGAEYMQYGICYGNNEYFVPTLVNGVSVLTLSESAPSATEIQYIRITHNTSEVGSGEDLIVTVNEVINDVGGVLTPVVPYTEVTYTEVGTHTFTVPNGVSKVKVAVIGGGGGYSKTADILPSGSSSFGDITAMGGGNAWGNCRTQPVVAEPNGKIVPPSITDVYADRNAYLDGAKGFKLDFTLDDGEYGAGGRTALQFPFDMDKNTMVNAVGEILYGSFSGAKVIETIDVSAGQTYTVVVGDGGGMTVPASFYATNDTEANMGGDKGNSGAVLVAFGGDI